MQESQWYNVYQSLAIALDAFYLKNRKKSGENFFELCMQYPTEFFKNVRFAEKFTQADWYKSLDPIHIFASFNNFNIRAETRKNKLLFYYKVLKIDDTIVKNTELDIFPYFPHPNIVQIVGNRSLDAQQEVWSFFHALFVNDTKTIQRSFDEKINDWYGVRLPALTTFMFWVFSGRYLPLDTNTVALLKENGTVSFPISTYKSYMLLNDRGRGLSENIYRNVAHYAYKEKSDIQLADEDLFEVEAFLNGLKLKDFEIEFDRKVEMAKKASPEKRQDALNDVNPYPERLNVQASVFKRNPYVVVAVLERANGICEYCHSPAPFSRKSDGSAFLEVHHEIHLADGGPDTVDNAKAVCPNCHRKAHFG